MALNLSKVFLTCSASILLFAASVASSDARPNGKRPTPSQGESVYFYSGYDSNRNEDASCFRSTGLPDLYACTSHGG